MYAYGPVPSRRLGQSIGINNIPAKICSYSCIYCQLGNTIQMQADRAEFYPPERIFNEVKSQVRKAEERGERIDYLTFVPDGEPTLDMNLGKEIKLLKSLDKKIAVIQNSSLLWREDVRNELIEADWVSLKVDSVTQSRWSLINRPHKKLNLVDILEGQKEFAKNYKGKLATETMMIRKYNDGLEEVDRVAEFLKEIKPDTAYIAIPTRPPAENYVKAADETGVNQAFQIFSNKLENVEYLIGYEGDAFAYTGDVERDLLSITSVHPMREEGVKNLLLKADSDWKLIEKLLREEKILELEYRDKKFYMRKIPSRISH